MVQKLFQQGEPFLAVSAFMGKQGSVPESFHLLNNLHDLDFEIGKISKLFQCHERKETSC